MVWSVCVDLSYTINIFLTYLTRYVSKAKLIFSFVANNHTGITQNIWQANIYDDTWPPKIGKYMFQSNIPIFLALSFLDTIFFQAWSLDTFLWFMDPLERTRITMGSYSCFVSTAFQNNLVFHDNFRLAVFTHFVLIKIAWQRS